jgi:diguanylate cyclase (GGDEF)-like protein
MAWLARVTDFACLRRLFVLLLLIGAAAAGATPANATEVRLREHMQVAEVSASSAGDGWTWLTLEDAAALGPMPADWRLLVDQVRFEAIAVIVVKHDGQAIRQVRTAGQLQHNWAPGGVLKFDVRPPGSEIRRVHLGFKALDDLALMRKVTAVSGERAATLDARWLVLMGAFTGLLVSAFVYNLLVHVGQRHAFQRWYLGWVSVMLAYGLTWSNLAAFVVPGLAGPVAVRVDNVLVSAGVALGGMFLLSVLESGTVPRALRRAAQAAAWLCFASGWLAADERMIDAAIGDRLLNYGMVASVATSLVVIAVAISRRSRVVWIYLAGWAPVISVFAARVARNFGLVPQTDLVDYATFAAIGLESIVFSLLIASRFAMLRRQRDAARATAREMHIEQETLHRAAHTDFLTGLANRASFQSALSELWSGRGRFALFLIDVDYLKALNDRQGHDSGDALLRFIGARLADLKPAAACCARIGGDEFAILALEETGDARTVSTALDALQGSVWARGASAGIVSLSIGKASSAGAESAAELFKHADLALYDAKKAGRGRLQRFDEGLRLRIQTRSDLIKEARQALARGEFVLYFQPIIDLRHERVASVEALLRWQHPTRGLLTPGMFECVLEDPEVGPEVQRRVLKLAIAWLRRHAAAAGPLSVNFTAMDLRGADGASRLLAKLARAGVPPSALCVEVTEGTVFGRAGDEPATALRILHEAGVRVALDDFGTGYASLVHLKEIPVDILKIDQSFIDGLLEDDGASEEIVRAVLALGHGLKKEVIAEGVETIAQLTRLRELGCAYAQGFLLGRPSPTLPAGIALRKAA